MSNNFKCVVCNSNVTQIAQKIFPSISVLLFGEAFDVDIFNIIHNKSGYNISRFEHLSLCVYFLGGIGVSTFCTKQANKYFTALGNEPLPSKQLDYKLQNITYSNDLDLVA